MVSGAVAGVWELPVDALAGVATSLAHLLDDDEQGRWRRLHRREDRDRFLVGHVACRLVLARELGSEPGLIGFDRTCRHCGAGHGKPFVPGAPIDFSLSHSGRWVVLATTTGGCIGADVEGTDGPPDHERFRERVLAPEERPRVASRRELIEIWTRKEACAKAVGLGLRVPFDSFVVDDTGPHPATPDPWGADPWWCRSFALDARHVAAVAASPPPAGARFVRVDGLTADGPAGTPLVR